MKKFDFISIADTSPEMLRHLLDTAIMLKAQRRAKGANAPNAAGRVLVMIFEKPSLRTRVSFETAMVHLGGAAIYLSPQEIGLGQRETVADAARVLSGFCDAIMARTFAHQTIVDLARFSTKPVINGLSDYSHPCQAMADLMTIEEHFGKLAGLTLAYVGDGNNVARSLMFACNRFGVKFNIACPPGYELPETRSQQPSPGAEVLATHDPTEAVRTADIIYTDTWVSMGQEAEKSSRRELFQPYQVNAALLAQAPAHAVVMHCLPAYRGLEITADVIDTPRSLVFEQAENRMHFQKGLLAVQLPALVTP